MAVHNLKNLIKLKSPALRILLLALLFASSCQHAVADWPDKKDDKSKSNNSASGGSNNSSNQQEDDEDAAEKTYGSTLAPNIKRLDSNMKEAQQVLTNTEFLNFQSRYSGIKQNAAIEFNQGLKGTAYIEPMKQLESELNQSMDIARQTYKQNKDKLDQAMAHLRTAFSERSSALTREDQERLSDMIADLQSRINGIASGADTAARMATLAEEAAQMETTIVGRTLFNSAGEPQNRPSTPPSRRSVQVSNDKKPTDDDWFNTPIKPGTKLLPLPVIQKPPLDQVFKQVETIIQQLTDRGELGSLDKDQFDRRLSDNRKIISSTAKGKISQVQEETIRKELADIVNELKEFGRH